MVLVLCFWSFGYSGCRGLLSNVCIGCGFVWVWVFGALLAFLLVASLHWLALDLLGCWEAGWTCLG